MSNQAILLVNFGGPRSLEEVEPFLAELLCDRDVIPSRLPSFLHNWFFKRIARKRAVKIGPDYQLIGGRSPIYEDTETVAALIEHKLSCPVVTFHRYLQETHAHTIMQLENLGCDEIRVIPMFPQFSYATTGSIARFLDEHLSSETRGKLSWIKSYPAHPAYVGVMQTMIREFLDVNQLFEEKTLLFFSAHGLPQVYIDEGDVYEKECQTSFEKIRTAFPRAFHLLAYQSKFGRGEWLKPSTQEMCEQLDKPDNIVIIPLSFTSDHIETLFEIEYLYLPILQKKGISAYRLPALNRRPDWIDALTQIIQDPSSVSTQMLIKH